MTSRYAQMEKNKEDRMNPIQTPEARIRTGDRGEPKRIEVFVRPQDVLAFVDWQGRTEKEICLTFEVDPEFDPAA